MILVVKDMLSSDMSFSKHSVTLTNVTLTASGFVSTDWSAVFVSISVSDKLSDTFVAVLFACTLQAILILLTDSVELIDWWTVARVGHWSVTKNQTIATISPVFALVEIRVEEAHHGC